MPLFYSNTFFDLIFDEGEDFANIRIQTNRPIGDLFRTSGFSVVYADVSCVFVGVGHSPKGLFYIDGRISAHAEFQKYDLSFRVFFDKSLVSLACFTPSFVLYEGVVGA